MTDFYLPTRPRIGQVSNGYVWDGRKWVRVAGVSTRVVPVVTVAPLISGTPAIGQVLTCSSGTWTLSPSGYVYTWRRNDMTIYGTTGNTYTVAPEDSGTSITCIVAAIGAEGAGYAISSNAMDIPSSIPTNTVAPVISGTQLVGSTLSCTTGTWTNTPTSYAYQWKRNGTNILSATSSTYLLTVTDGGTSVTCAVTASNLSGASTPAISNSLAIPGIPVNSVAPVISGVATVGNTLTCTTGTWSNTPTAYNYQWKRSGIAVSGATNNTYLLTAPDDGISITCTVIADNSAGASLPATSNALVIGSGGGTTVGPIGLLLTMMGVR